MHIGIVPTLRRSYGGMYHYTHILLEALADLSRQELGEEYILFVQTEYKQFLLNLNRVRWDRIPLQPLFKDRILDLLRWSLGDGRLREDLNKLRHQIIPQRIPDPDRIQRRPEFTRWFNRHGVDWVLYTAPKVLSFEAGLPYVMPVHDLQHRLQPEFPEVSANGEWERREYLFRNGTRYATLILADSEVGKEDILEFYGPYGVTPGRVKVLPFLPANYLSVDVPEGERIRVRQAYRLPKRYLFYPAQFWPHKNHARIVQALGLLREEGWDEIHVVFSGSYIGEIRARTFREVMKLSHRLGISSQVHYLGYVPDEDMSGLYSEAAGLIMPTFFGPTNLPILEAWAFGCPVLTSDIRGIREQVGDAGLLVDPRSVEAIAEGINRLWEDKALRQELAQRGSTRLASYTPEDFRRQLANIIQEASERVRQGRHPTYTVSEHSS